MLRAGLSSQFASKASLEAITSNKKDERSLSQDVTSLSQVLSQECHELEQRFYARAITVLAELAKAPQSLKSLMTLTGDTNRGRFKNNVIRHIMDAGFVEPTFTDNPNSPKQKYTLTVKGEELMKSYEV